MTSERFLDLALLYPRLRVAVVGDFCSIETRLPVHNITPAATMILPPMILPDLGGREARTGKKSRIMVGKIIDQMSFAPRSELHELHRAIAEAAPPHVTHATFVTHVTL